MGEAKRRAAAGREVTPPNADEAVDRLRRLFAGLGIVPDEIAFYDSPAFIAAEQKDPEFLKAYAEWVMVRPRSSEYNAYVRSVVPKVANIVGHRLGVEQVYGACLNTAGGLVRMFDRLGIWSFVVCGSTNIQDLDHPELGSRYWWDVDKIDHPEGVAGHAWVCAPPYMIVDVTLKNQQWDGEGFGDLLPEAILVDNGIRIVPKVSDIVSKGYRNYYAFKEGRYDPLLHQRLKPDLKWMVNTFGAWQANVGRACLRYVPSAVTAIQEDLEEIGCGSNLRIRLVDIWNEEVMPVL